MSMGFPCVITQTPSGLVVVEQEYKPEPPRSESHPLLPRYGRMEVQDPEERKVVLKLLGEMWTVLRLVEASGIETADGKQYRREAHKRAIYYLGDLLLGKDYPGGEEWT